MSGQETEAGSGRGPREARAPRVVRLGADLPADAPAAGRAAAIDGRLVSFLDPGSLEAEQYRALRHVLERCSGGPAVIAVTSAVPGEGKTTTAVNLAGALAQDAEARILLVDADLRRPSVARQLGLGALLPGLVESASDPDSEPGDFVRRRPPSRLSILPAGRIPDRPYELLKSPRLGEVFQTLRRRYDTVVVDASPALPVPDVRILAKWVDAFLLVVAAHRTPRRLVGEALDRLDPSRVIGIVFNGDDRPSAASYGYYYGRGAGRGTARGAAPGGWGEAGAS